MLNVSEHLMVSKYLLGLILATFPEAKEKANRFKRRSSLICFQETFRKNQWVFWIAVKWNGIGAVLGYFWGILRASRSR